MYRIVVCLVALVSAHCLSVPTTQAQFFIDRFDDGSATDGMPVTWLPLAPFDGGTRDVINDSYLLTPGPDPILFPNYSEVDSIVEGREFAEVSLRTSVRITNGSTDSIIGVFARNAAVGNDSAVWGAFDSRGLLIIGAFSTELDREKRWEATTDLNAFGTDLNLQFDVFETSMELTAWQEGDAKPLVPDVVVTQIPEYVPSEGGVGVWTGQLLDSPRSPVAFRFFEAAPIPEPASYVMTVAGLLGLAVLRRK